jgi:hypothetical protein
MKDKTFLIDGGCEADLEVNRRGEFILTLNAPKDHAEIKITEVQAKEWIRKFCPEDSWKKLVKEANSYLQNNQ